MTDAERTLLLALFRWAGAEGLLRPGGLYNWAQRGGPPRLRFGITFRADEWGRGEPVALEIWRASMSVKTYWVASIAEAVDVLAALSIVPARFSTAYRAGWDAGYNADDTPAGDAFRAIVPVVPS